MDHVDLYAADDELVATVEVQSFHILQPEIIQWGERIFVLRDGRYMEGAVFVVPIPLKRKET